MSSSTQIFSEIYEKNFWTNGSGPGSSVEATLPYRTLLTNLIQSLKIKSIGDIACGDMQFMSLINLGMVDYTGYDVVSKVIETDRRMFPGLRFECVDLITDTDKISPCDMMLVKDLFIHWPTEIIMDVLPKLLEKTKYLLLTNDFFQEDVQRNIKLGEFCGLDSKMYPLNQFPLVHMGRYENKDILLLVGKKQI